MTESNTKCRVCWSNKDLKTCIQVSSKWSVESTKSIKDIILLCVPWMTIQNKDQICKPCLWQLKFTYSFIERCLKTENIFNEINNTGNEQLTLENVFEKSLRQGHKIQIIFENSEPEVQNNLESSTFQESIEVHDEPLKKNDEDHEVIDLDIRNSSNNESSEHDYCIKSGSQLEVKTKVLIEQKENESDVTLNNDTKNLLVDSENITDDNDVIFDDNDLDKSNEEFAVSKDTSKITEISTSSKKKKDVDGGKSESEKKVTNPLDPPVRNVLTDLLDIDGGDVWFITSRNEITTEQKEDLVRDGINILNMATDPSKKKRTIFLSRDLRLGIYDCSRCQEKFQTKCDYLDHTHMHRKGKTPGSTVHTCPVCLETFGYDIDFRTHTKFIHGIAQPHVCSRCNKRFKTIKLLNEHNKTFKDMEKCKYKCSQCSKEFNNAAAFKAHKESAKDAPSCNYQKCNVCSQKFTREEFKIHCKNVHPHCLCQECGKSFPDVASLSAHRRNVHTGKASTMCHECGKILSHPRALEHHIQTTHGEKTFMCDQCPRSFTCLTYLRKHCSQIHSEARRTGSAKWKCEKCNKEMRSQSGLRFHERMFHLGIKKYVCPRCNEGFLRGDYFRRHLEQHERYVDNTCQICGKSFAFGWKLEHHMLLGHDENGKPLQTGYIRRKPKTKYINTQPRCICKICDKVLANKEGLNMHYKAHLKLRTFKCNICGLTFQTHMSLKNHVKLHKDPTFRFRCNICYAHHTSSRELEKHTKEVHKNKKYICKLCNKAFGRKHLLADHEATDHQEVNKKKELLLSILEKDHIYIDSEMAPGSGRRRKGCKIGNLEVDIDQVFEDFVGNSELIENTSEVESMEEEIEYDTQENIPVDSSEYSDVVVVRNEYQNSEEKTACRIIEEENKLHEIYINYKD